ncbi:amino acid ABC transporter permease [Paracoccus pacificus]|uniref:Amino acid ABC transporter permease n=1 Tax=Paracoccus pacificus TaxID=1463598 RepID=A0ABW4R7P8_9RHOB
MIPPSPPPMRQAGAIKWLRENLFSGPLNTALSIIGIIIVWLLVQGILPWLSHSVWDAQNLRECRNIIAERFGAGAEGACWAMVRDRWSQFLFGFYPNALYWRATLAFALLFVALAPILFSESLKIRRIILIAAAAIGVLGIIFGHAPVWVVVATWFGAAVWLWAGEFAPTKLLWFTALYPALAYWLLWGGSAWDPIMALAGFLIGYIAWRLLAARSTLVAAIVAVVLAMLWWLYYSGDAARDAEDLISLSIPQVSSRYFGGFLLSTTIGVAAIAMSLPMGIILALARRSDMFLVRALAVTFIEFIRGVPLITLLFVASLLLNYFLPPGTNFDIILRVVIMVTIFAAAYMAEVIRGGLAALPKGQYEAADSLGLDYWKAQRLIILPQALKISIPGIVSTFIGVFKDTTLVVFVGLLDPLKGITDAVRASTDWKGIYWEPYIFVALIFFTFCFAMSRYSMYLERRLKRDNH